MINAALVVAIVMYAVSFSVLGAQYIVGDVFNIELTNLNGEPVQSHILTIIDEDEINQTSENMINANFTSNSTYYNKVETFTTGAAYVAWELVTLASGTYIFNFLYLMGVPLFFCAVMVIIYAGFLLGRFIVGIVRGI